MNPKVFVLMVSLCCTGGFATAQVSESFDTPDSTILGPDQAWTEYLIKTPTDTWEVQGNRAKTSVTGVTYARCNAIVGSNQMVSAAIAFPQGGSYVGVWLRATPDNHSGYLCYVTHTTYSSQLLIFRRRPDGVVQQKASFRLPGDSQPGQLVAMAFDNQVAMSFAGYDLSWIDPDPLAGEHAGLCAVGLAGAGFDDFLAIPVE